MTPPRGSRCGSVAALEGGFAVTFGDGFAVTLGGEIQ